MGRRTLVSIRREVPETRRGEYDAAWARLAEVAGSGGAHAWRFVAASHPTRFVEFLELRDDDPTSLPGIPPLLAELADRFGGEAEAWHALS